MQVRRRVVRSATNFFTSSSVIASMPGDRAEDGVTVRRAGEDDVLQPLLAELLLVVVAQVLLQRVELLVLEALEILLAEARRQQLRQHDVQERRPVVAVDRRR